MSVLWSFLWGLLYALGWFALLGVGMAVSLVCLWLWGPK